MKKKQPPPKGRPNYREETSKTATCVVFPWTTKHHTAAHKIVRATFASTEKVIGMARVPFCRSRRTVRHAPCMTLDHGRPTDHRPFSIPGGSRRPRPHARHVGCRPVRQSRRGSGGRHENSHRVATGDRSDRIGTLARARPGKNCLAVDGYFRRTRTIFPHPGRRDRPCSGIASARCPEYRRRLSAGEPQVSPQGLRDT